MRSADRSSFCPCWDRRSHLSPVVKKQSSNNQIRRHSFTPWHVLTRPPSSNCSLASRRPPQQPDVAAQTHSMPLDDPTQPPADARWSIFSVPRPIRRIFDAFPLRVYPPNAQPVFRVCASTSLVKASPAPPTRAQRSPEPRQEGQPQPSGEPEDH